MNVKKNIEIFSLMIQEISEQYKNNNKIQLKLENYINTGLKNHLEQICIKENKKYNNNLEIANIKEEERLKILEEQNKFINDFINNNKYYYINSTDIFINYDGNIFQTVREDDILYHILSTISQNKFLYSSKHKLKLIIIKKIKEKNLMDIIPESKTIQNCFELLIPNICSNKDQAKYFLTALGDVIQKKHENLIYLINISVKNFIKIIADQSYYYFGININNLFKYKYHEQISHNNYRLINLSYRNIELKGNYLNTINKNLLNLLSVANHYSNRFGNSENFITNCYNISLINYTLYLKDNSIEQIVNNFIDKNLIICENSYINSKNMIYLWKIYLNEKNIPNLIFQNTLKILLKDKLSYNEDKDIFKNIFSTSLPLVSNFLEFWEDTIVDDDTELYLELSEIIILFKSWSKVPIKIDDAFNIIDIIKYYYSEIIIENNQYILNISCNFWNKNEEINKFLDEEKLNLEEKQEFNSISLDNLYKSYCNSCKNKKNLIIINKIYFENYVEENLINFINKNKSISSNWWKLNT